MGANVISIKAIDKLKTGVYEFELKTDIPKKARRSTLQNNYYWGCVLSELVRSVDDSYTAEQFHDMLKAIYFGHTAIGNSYIINGSTAALNTTEMEQYLRGCREWAWENLNLTIQLPNEAGFIY